MDPFAEVELDCWSQINSLENFINATSNITDEATLDFENNHQELHETLEDLRQAVRISESNPTEFRLTSSDITSRKQVLAKLEAKSLSLNEEWTLKRSSRRRNREITSVNNRISQDAGRDEDPFSDTARIDLEFDQYQQQEMIQEQDMQLDAIHITMQNLNQQAMLMGSELEEQGFMLEDLDQEIDTVGAKLQRGMKRVNYVIEKNRETASNCCIGILVVVLTVLLVMLIVA
ncbi:hypothetical protein METBISCDRAFT_16807 [Metschnikowia bicuspidata]|uniref:t-SNARE affecting a late Golgi compartment protein 1 n=1 Tax=Metschnikowia bicuspidata TaxID=27322 RepID=A0A4P9ZC27_9ASCO|nr:hypothetical protein METBISCDRAFT_16807 [Metschnikowia bicuspidata]